jgi:hypothetical protein
MWPPSTSVSPTTAKSATQLIYASKDTQSNSRTFNRKVDVIRWAKQQETAALLFTMVAALQPVNSRRRVAHSSDLTYNLRLFKEEL